MASVNKIILVGHLGKDPESRYLPNGDAVCNFPIATSESWTDKASGEKRELTEWHRLCLFRKNAEIAAQYLKKGALIYVEGKVRTRKYTDPQGAERFIVEVHVDAFKMLGKKDAAAGDTQAPAAAPSATPAPSAAPPRPPAASTPPDEFDNFDDLPF